MIRMIMADEIFPLDRRELLTALGVAVLAPSLPRIAAAQGRPSLLLQARAGALALRPGAPNTPIWSLEAQAADRHLRFKRGDELEITLQNELPVPTVLDCHGLDGAPAAEPLTVRAPLPPGGKESFVIPLRHAGTFMCGLRLLGDGQALPSQDLALIVGESEAITVDRDEVLLIEDWRLRADGTESAACARSLVRFDEEEECGVAGARPPQGPSLRRLTPPCALDTVQAIPRRWMGGLRRGSSRLHNAVWPVAPLGSAA